jgi:hypothetical protein
MTVSKVQRYTKFKRTTESIFVIAFLRRILKAWSLTPTKIVKFMDKKRMNMMSKTLLSLQMRTKKKITIKDKIANNIQKKSIATKRVSVVLTYRK